MGWERRQRGGWYYCRTRWVGGRFVREYVGGGEAGAAAAAEDERRRAERRALREDARAEADRLDAADAPARQLDGWADLLARAALTGAGLYRHDHGEWRRRKDVPGTGPQAG